MDAPLGPIRARAYEIPTDAPEADGTFAWGATTLVVAEIEGGGRTGLGYSYTAAGAARFIERVHVPAIRGQDALASGTAWAAMQRAVRNIGRAGLAATAISAVDAALWDLRGKLLGAPVAAL